MDGFGSRLKLARSRSRLSQRALAGRVGVSPMAISKYENEEMMPSSDVLRRLAEALDVRMEFFLREAPNLEIQSTFRKHKRMGAKAEQAVMADIQEWLERYLALESFFPAEEVPAFHYPNGFPYQIEMVEDGERAAQRLREAWSLGDDPIDNLAELLEAKGIKVGMVEADVNFDACTFRYDGNTPVIAVRREVPGDRERFSLAHELGHIMMAVAPGVDEERAANRFAGAFLVPARAVYLELGHSRRHLDPYELLMLKEKYGMSMAAWIYRAQDLGILNQNDGRRMWRDFSARGWRKEEPGQALPTEEPNRLLRLVRRLLAEDVISRSRAAELSGERISVFQDREEEALAMRG